MSESEGTLLQKPFMMLTYYATSVSDPIITPLIIIFCISLKINSNNFYSKSRIWSTYPHWNKDIVLLQLKKMWNIELISFETRNFKMAVNEVQRAFWIPKNQLATSWCTCSHHNILQNTKFKMKTETHSKYTKRSNASYEFS